jgi:hypothetical protein
MPNFALLLSSVDISNFISPRTFISRKKVKTFLKFRDVSLKKGLGFFKKGLGFFKKGLGL